MTMEIFSADSPGTEKGRILVIDDEQPARMMMMDFLEDAGYETLEAENGQRGLEILEKERPDAVLTDIRMPVMDGLQVVEKMKEIAPLIPVIIVSGTGLMENVISALRLGAWDYILKPVQNLDVLDHVIRKSFEKSALLRLEKNYQSQLEKEVRIKTASLEAEIVAREIAQIRLQHEAYHDALTGLGNRLHCLKDLQKLSEIPEKASCGFLLFDISSLKNINKAYGLSVGDQILVLVAERLSQFTQKGVKVYRTGADEFSALLQGPDPEKVNILAQNISDSVRGPYRLKDQSFNVGFVFGLTLFSFNNKSCESPINEAAFAHLQAKKNPHNPMVIYDDRLHQAFMRRLALEKEMPDALARGEFSLVYQPILDQRNRKLFGFEGLMRWNSKDHGPVSPGEFIAIAEECGFIMELGEWAVEKACRFWIEKGLCQDPLMLSMNVSGQQFLDQALVLRFKKILEKTGFDPKRLCLEITESTLMTQVLETEKKLSQFRELGVKISIDDFGTGYSSLEYLHRFPVDILKIDMSFVHKMEKDPKTRELIKVMKHMVDIFGLELVAEGVETEIQQTLLSEIGCHLQQGFFYSRPLAEKDFRLDF